MYGNVPETGSMTNKEEESQKKGTTKSENWQINTRNAETTKGPRESVETPGLLRKPNPQRAIPMFGGQNFLRKKL